MGRLLASAMVSIAVWIGLLFGLQSTLGHDVAYARVVFFVGLVVLTLLAVFVLRLVGKVFPAAWRVGATLIALPALAIGILVLYTPLIISDIVFQSSSTMPMPIYGSLIWLYYSFIIFVMAVVGLLAVWGERAASNNLLKRQLTIVATSTLLSVVGGSITNLVIPALTRDSSSSLLMPVAVLILSSGLSYAIVRHSLFDIKQATMRTVGYALTISAMAGIYVVLAYAVSMLFFRGEVVEGVSFSPLNIGLALILAFIFQPIKRFFDRITNKIFYCNEYDRDVFLVEFGRILSHDTDLRLLLNDANDYLATNLKAEQSYFYLIDRGIHGNGSVKANKITDEEVEQLANYYRQQAEEPRAIVAEAVTYEPIKRILDRRKITIMLPLVAQKQIFGFFFLGEHKSRDYSRRDINTLQSIANELTIAIQNSLSVEEVRELNRTLQHRVDEATKELRTTNRQLQRLDEAKDEFMSIASHQLRTPLTTIKGYLDMVLDGDMGKITSMQHKVLSEAFMSSERMVQLINDFLNISRLQTGKFMIDRTWIDLTDIVREELQLLKVVAKQRDLKLVSNFAKDVPLINADGEKLRQVIINMIDNAIYYSNPGTSIQVNLKKEDKSLVFTVVDTGIGVPKSEQVGLFGKFFRGSNARKRRPDGTGVGLFLAKKVVTAHGGEMIFESTEGKGSTFGFRLPIKQSIDKDNEEVDE